MIKQKCFSCKREWDEDECIFAWESFFHFKCFVCSIRFIESKILCEIKEFFYRIRAPVREFYFIKRNKPKYVTTYWIIIDKDNWYMRHSPIYWDKEWLWNAAQEKEILENKFRWEIL